MYKTGRVITHCIPLDNFFELIPAELLKSYITIFGYKDSGCHSSSSLELPITWACELICTAQRYLSVAELEAQLYWDEIFEYAEEAAALQSGNTQYNFKASDATMMFSTTIWFIYNALYDIIIQYQSPQELFSHVAIQKWTTYSLFIEIGYQYPQSRGSSNSITDETNHRDKW